MVAKTYDEAMRRVYADEGGYSNDAADPGGPTNWGITIGDVRTYLKPKATAADVRALTKAQAAEIYSKHYARPVRYNDLPAGLDYTIFDYGINSGVGRAGKVLRRVIGLPYNTSTINDDVLLAVSKREGRAIIVAVNDERLRFLYSLKTWPTFGKGWERRVKGCRAASLVMSGGTAGAKTPLPIPAPTKGKGTIPDPKGTKGTVAVGAGGAATAAGATWVDWVALHPVLTAAIALAVMVSAAIIIVKINGWHKKKSEEPMPDIHVVPELRASS